MISANPQEASISQFRLLCKQAEDAFGEELEISFESALLSVLDFVKQHPESRVHFADEFKRILYDKSLPFELVAFCMRELQWPEIKEFAVARMNASADPRSEALRSLVTAYDKNWPDSDLYEYYGGRGTQ